MNIHDQLRHQHLELQPLGQAVEQAMGSRGSVLTDRFTGFQQAALRHFRRLDRYYEQLDVNRRVADRALMHDLRNDHAAVVFTLESLGIRLRKSGINDDWRKRWTSLTDVLWPYLQRLEKDLFPLGESLLTEQDRSALQKTMDTPE